MARLIGESQTTKAEQEVLEFLFLNSGEEFTPQEIEKETGIRADLVPAIMDNLRWKGFEVATRNGKHYFIKNTLLGYLVGGLMVAFMILVIMAGWSNYLSTCPGCPPDDYPEKVAIIEE